METNIQGVILGEDKLKAINKQVGDRIKVYSFNYKDIDFEVEIVGTFPPRPVRPVAAMNVEYFRRSLDAYERAKGQAAPAGRQVAEPVLGAVPRQGRATSGTPRWSASRASSRRRRSRSRWRRRPSRRSSTPTRTSSGACAYLMAPAILGGDRADHRHRHQHQRPRAADGDGGPQGARVSRRGRSWCWCWARRCWSAP